MKRAIYFASLFMLLEVTTYAAAQSNTAAAPAQEPSATSQTTIVIREPGATCPVGMRALQGTGQGLVRVRNQRPEIRNGPPAGVPSQRIHLILADHRPGSIERARVLVSGLSPKNRMRNLSGLDAPTDISKTMEVTLQPEDAASASADLVLPGFTTVNSIGLLSITYDDGSTWNVMKGKACRVTPDPLMLIAEH